MVLRNYNLCMLFPLIADGICGVPIQILKVICSSNIPQPGRTTYSHIPDQQPAITKVMCHMLWSSV